MGQVSFSLAEGGRQKKFYHFSRMGTGALFISQIDMSNLKYVVVFARWLYVSSHANLTKPANTYCCQDLRVHLY